MKDTALIESALALMEQEQEVLRKKATLFSIQLAPLQQGLDRIVSTLDALREPVFQLRSLLALLKADGAMDATRIDETNKSS